VVSIFDVDFTRISTKIHIFIILNFFVKNNINSLLWVWLIFYWCCINNFRSKNINICYFIFYSPVFTRSREVFSCRTYNKTSWALMDKSLNEREREHLVEKEALMNVM